MEEFLIEIDQDEMRIDAVLAEQFPDLSRSHFQKLIKDGKILINGESVKPSYKCSVDDSVTLFDIEPKPVEIVPEDIPLDILFEDSDILVVNKIWWFIQETVIYQELWLTPLCFIARMICPVLMVKFARESCIVSIKIPQEAL